jgi:hypothetical protein
MPAGRPCGAPPGRESRHCFWHDPGKAEDLAEAQRLGGIRRKRERTLAVAYDFEGLGSIEAIRRLLEIAATDAFSLENSVQRVRALIATAQAAAKLLETGELEERLASLEDLLRRRRERDLVDDPGI